MQIGEVTCCIIFGAFSCTLHAQNPYFSDSLVLASKHFSGVWAIKTSEGKYSQAIGWANANRQTRMDTSTIFPLGYLSEVFCGYIFSQEEQKAHISRAQALNEFALGNIPDSLRNITIKQLLSCNVNFNWKNQSVSADSSFTFFKNAVTTDTFDSLLSANLVRASSQNYLRWAPYRLISEALSQASDIPWPLLARQDLEASGFTNAGQAPCDPSALSWASGQLFSNQKWHQVKLPCLYQLQGAAGMFSNLSGIFHLDSILSQSLPGTLLYTQYQTNTIEGPGEWGKIKEGSNDYRLWSLKSRIPGYSAAWIRIPQAEITMVVLCNNESFNLDEELASGIFDKIIREALTSTPRSMANSKK